MNGFRSIKRVDIKLENSMIHPFLTKFFTYVTYSITEYAVTRKQGYVIRLYKLFLLFYCVEFVLLTSSGSIYIYIVYCIYNNNNNNVIIILVKFETNLIYTNNIYNMYYMVITLDIDESHHPY